jgi:hypothetical protein
LAIKIYLNLVMKIWSGKFASPLHIFGVTAGAY